MDQRDDSKLSEPRFMWWLFLILSMSFLLSGALCANDGSWNLKKPGQLVERHLTPQIFRGCEGCKADLCSSQYTEALDREKIDRPEPTVASCTILRNFGKCLRMMAKECHGNIPYHSSIVMVKQLSKENNCVALIGPDKTQSGPPLMRPSVIPKLPTNVIPVSVSTPRSCTFLGRNKFRYCGLFGDPHLKTFYSSYQTCKLKGAWPLIDNPYLAVSVTNEPVMENSPATVTTKVTVIIKGRGTFCTQEKTFEAQSDQPLQASFVDGTYTSGPNESVRLKMEEIDENHQLVEIYLKYIETTLVIRQVGKYLAFAARLPEEVALMDGEDLQLCSSGCPTSEQLNLAVDHGEAMPWEEALRRCQNSEGLSNRINNRLTDHYLDWCVFDVMTTGELASADFTAAAHSAQADVLRFDPESLRNRTTTKLRPRDVKALPAGGSSDCDRCYPVTMRILLVTATMIAIIVK